MRDRAHHFVFSGDVLKKKCIISRILSKISRATNSDPFATSGQGMDVEGIHGLVEQGIDSNLGYPTASHFVYNKDFHGSFPLHTLNWNLQEYFDPNHVKISLSHFRLLFQLLPQPSVEIEIPLKESFDAASHSDDLLESQQEMWQNMENSFARDHSKCNHPTREDCLPWSGTGIEGAPELLHSFLEDTWADPEGVPL
jgi:hypothetical protein